MSAAKLFPPLETVEPVTLVEAVESLSKIHSGSGANNLRRWEQLLDKVRKEEKLKAFEKIQMVCNASSIPADLQKQFGRMFREDLTVDELLSSAESVAMNLSPREALEHLTHEEILSNFGRSHFPSGIFQAAHILGDADSERQWAEERIQSGETILNLVESFSVKQLAGRKSSGQKRIIRALIAARSLGKYADREFTSIVELLKELKTDGIDCLGLFDEFLGNYFEFDKNWGTKVLDERSFLSHSLSEVPDLTTEKAKLHQYRNIEALRKKVNELVDVLKMLNEVEPDRGNFWKKYLSLCHYVEPKRIDKNSVATAFAFPSFVIVEFAPVGTSALIYDRNTFDAELRKNKNWRDLNYVKLTPPYSRDGRLLHVSNWQRTFNELIVELLQRERQLR